MRPIREPVSAGEESVWDYPRPPALERTGAHIVVVLGGEVVADTRAAWRVLETSHPPNYYLPIADVATDALEAGAGTSFCEWKGRATYYTVRGGDRVERDAAWGYATPNPRFAAIVDHVAFYAGRMDACFVDDERVAAQPGGFYGGWITAGVKGPFKGAPGTRGW